MEESLRKRIENRRRKERRIARIKYAILAAVAVVVFLNVIGSARAQITEKQPKICISYCIQPGDTLTDIAREHGCKEEKEVQAYIKEVMKMNHLENDSITAGAYIIIPK